MWTWWLEFAGRQSLDELRRQNDLIARMEGRRRLLGLIPFAIATIFLPAWICLGLMVANLLLETAGIRMLGRAEPQRAPGQYLVSLLTFVVAQATYMAVPALVFHVEDEMAKAYALGLFLINVVHLATVRTVHYPLAMVALIPATLIAAGTNTLFWLARGDGAGLAVSSLAVVAVAYFVLVVTSTVHDLHREMVENQRLAEVANRAKTRFLAQMSHELRTPLNAIMGLGYAEMAEASSTASRDRLSTMVQSARSLSLLLDDILDMSAAQAGQLPIRPGDTDLSQVIAATLSLFNQQLSDARQSLTWSVAKDVPALVRLDGQRLRQCLSNILANAVKYGGPGQVTLQVGLAAPGKLVIDLSDSGPGVPAGFEEDIFEPFQRGDATVMGTGLGLSISRTLARRMGGDLILLPKRPGAHFRLSLAYEPAAPRAVSPPGGASPDRLPDLSGRRVLVVDDIATNRLVAMSYLRLMGAEAHEAASGPEALALLPDLAPDVVLLDMLMPGQDGPATLAAIRALPGALGRVPVIAMTADVTEDGRQRSLAAGMDGFLPKPVTPEALSAGLLAALAGRG